MKATMTVEEAFERVRLAIQVKRNTAADERREGFQGIAADLEQDADALGLVLEIARYGWKQAHR